MSATKKGFTLIEIMIVISIIGLLSIVLVPKVGSIKLQSKNKNVSTNVLLVRSYLDNRAGKDAGLYSDYLESQNIKSQALERVLGNIYNDMTSNFSENNALINPFSGSKTINKTETAAKNSSSLKPSILLYSSSDNIPKDSDIDNSSVLPKGIDIRGTTVVIVYGGDVEIKGNEKYVTNGGYVLYGIDDSGNIINHYLIRFPALPTSSSSGSDGNDEDDNNEDDNGNTETIADLFQSNCLNILGDSITNDIDIGNNGSGNMNINGSAYFQGKKINFVQNTDVSGNLTLVGTGDGSNVNIGVGNNNTLKVNGITNIQAKDVNIKSNLDTYNSIYILADHDVTFYNTGINANLNGGNAYIKSGNDINFSTNLSSSVPVNMIAGNNLKFDWYATNITSTTYLKGKNQVYIPQNATLGNTYIEANTFNYGDADIETSKLNTYVQNFSHGNGGFLKPEPEMQSDSTPEPEFVNDIATSKYQIKTIKSDISYNSSVNPYDNNDPNLAVSVLKNPDENTLKEVLTSQNIDANKYKLVIIDGDINISKRSINDYSNQDITLNNFIIYCTGKINFPTDSNFSNVTFNNSSIITRSMDTKLQSKFSINQLDTNQYNHNIKKKVNQYINQFLN
ncbi:prepilin-type N-terminal cleavage/methylation domain-containing protein [Clostridium tyrobutyricum]|uniref:prepilin-type N-terminal cleavage/methylation domain-containing protein n=1 Tax=Clostridium tyrobutyricum TaxID=1519 RepID=UPI00073D4C1F|nr:prepilin-type N-terminal cleavage/methylation domain-containing protein [Clostridium tyrobutyricum]